ncbi:MAG: hypothetical protein OEX00_11735 [Gammaproteobacteria bacterium]|nr:hypothetical protein [Gammaproteobacteria bacterium]MDH5727863.1 hypothetical protein [Gammaproteobacteria bacterium]
MNKNKIVNSLFAFTNILFLTFVFHQVSAANFTANPVFQDALWSVQHDKLLKTDIQTKQLKFSLDLDGNTKQVEIDDEHALV